MSLQTKFGILLALIGISVVGCAAAALWGVRVQNRLIVEPLRENADAADRLSGIKRDIDAQAALLAPSAGDGSEERGERRAEFESRRLTTERRLSELLDDDRLLRRVGRGTAANLRARIAEFERAAGEEFDSPSERGRAGIVARRFELHEIIELLERRITHDQQAAVRYGGDIRDRVRFVVVLSLVTAGLVGVLAVNLLRRWVLAPVAGVRRAAERIAAGDFEHRIEAGGRDEIAQLAREVNHMAEMVGRMQEEAVDRERLAAVGEMMRRLVHNLRNSIAGIRGLAELTRAELPAGNDLRGNQDRIIAAVDRFEKWLSDMLSATRPLELRHEEMPPEVLLRGVVEAHRPLAQAKSVRLELEVSGSPRVARFDPRHLEHSLVAIITNAIQASPAEGRVRVSATSGEGGGWWEIRVEDEGPGVAPQDVERIFRPYFTTKREGNGIGLAVAHRVVTGHGGRVWVEPGAGGGNGGGAGTGAVFVIRLPIADVEGAGEKVAGSRHAGAPGGQNPDR